MSFFSALYCPTSGVVDSHKFMEYLETDFVQTGGDAVYRRFFNCFVVCILFCTYFSHSEVTKVEKISGGYRVFVKDEHEVVDCFESKYVINAAGHGACAIAREVILISCRF